MSKHKRDLIFKNSDRLRAFARQGQVGRNMIEWKTFWILLTIRRDLTMSILDIDLTV